MNKHTIIPLAIGLIVGLIAITLGYTYIKKASGSKNYNLGPLKKVVVAKRDLSIGTKITKKDITTVLMPKKLIPKDVVVDPKKAINQTVKADIPAKLPILKNMLGPGQGLEGIIPEGYRAVSVKIDEFTGVAGLLRPGVRVDVVGTFKVRNATGKIDYVSKVVLQNVEVRAVGQKFRPEDADSPKTKLSRSVTLLVKSDQVEKLQLAASTGKIRLALRPAFDDKPIYTKGINLAKLLSESPALASATNKAGNFLSHLFSFAFKRNANSKHKTSNFQPAKVKTKKPKPKPFSVELIKGESSETIYFESPESDKRIDPESLDGELNGKTNEENEPEELVFKE